METRLLLYTPSSFHSWHFLADAWLVRKPSPSSIPVQFLWPTPLQHGRCAGHSVSADGDISTTARKTSASCSSPLHGTDRKQAQRVSVMHRIPHGKLWPWPSTWGMCRSLWVFRSHPSWNSHPSLEKERTSIFINGVSASQENKDGRSLCRSPKIVVVTRGRQSLRHPSLFYFSTLPLSEVQSWEENSSVCLEPFVWV